MYCGVCMHACVRMACVCVQVRMPMCTHAGQEALSILLCSCPCHPLRQGLSLDLDSCFLSEAGSQQPVAIPVSLHTLEAGLHPSLGYPACHRGAGIQTLVLTLSKQAAGHLANSSVQDQNLYLQFPNFFFFINSIGIL